MNAKEAGQTSPVFLLAISNQLSAISPNLPMAVRLPQPLNDLVSQADCLVLDNVSFKSRNIRSKQESRVRIPFVSIQKSVSSNQPNPVPLVAYERRSASTFLIRLASIFLISITLTSFGCGSHGSERVSLSLYSRR